MRISRHTVRNFLLRSGTVLALLFMILGTLLILRQDPHMLSAAHLHNSGILLDLAAAAHNNAERQKELQDQALAEYWKALNADPYNPEIWQKVSEYSDILPPDQRNRMKVIRRKIFGTERKL
ncbi:MAG: hypothetical protein KDI65_07530 [Alphaproteobacteria bacterium]|nr:hypothetical protein [Alphaproteobacteria bacterium]